MSNMSDRDFVKNFSMMIGALVAMAVVIFIIAQIISGNTKTAKTDGQADTTVAERIKPIGEVTIAGRVMDAVVPVANAAADGKSTYEGSCAACHAVGVAGAPKLGDKPAWDPRIAQGKDTLYKHAIGGYQGKAGFMPAKGGNAGLSDDAVKAAVDYMVSQAK